MEVFTSNGFTIRLDQPRALGGAWTVTTYKRRFLFRKRIGCDWFLDGAQAREFADQAVHALASGVAPAAFKSRPPGWKLRFPNKS